MKFINSDFEQEQLNKALKKREELEKERKKIILDYDVGKLINEIDYICKYLSCHINNKCDLEKLEKEMRGKNIEYSITMEFDEWFNERKEKLSSKK